MAARKTPRRRPVKSQYEFRGGVGKYAAKQREGTNVVLLEPDVVEVFPYSRAMNKALRKLAEIIRDRTQ